MGHGDPEDTDDGDTSARVNIDYIKSSLFRTIRPSGAIASITPQGQIQIAFFSERQAIPQRVVHDLGPDGELGEPIEIIGRDSVVREIDIAITMELDTVERLEVFLREHLAKAKKIGDLKE